MIGLARWHTFDEPLETDITLVAVVGRELLAGRALYADVWDHKPPALYLTHAAAIALVGFGPGAVYLLNVAAAVITLGGVYAAAGGGGPVVGLWAAAFWTVISGDLWLQANQPNTEALINACVVWAFALLATADARSGIPRFVGVGALWAWASLFKPTVAAPAALLALAWVVAPPSGRPRRRALGDMAVVAAVGALAWAAVATWFAAAGRFDALYDAVFTFNRWYTGDALANLVGSLSRRRLLNDILRSALPLAILSALGLGIGLAAGPRRRWLLLVAWAAGTQVAIGVNQSSIPHYYQLWLPVLTVGGAWAVEHVEWLARGRAPRLPTLTAAAALVVLLVFEVPLYALAPDDWSRIKYGPIFVGERAMAREVSGLLEPGETFFVWGSEVGLYFLTGVRPVCGPCSAWPLNTGPLLLGLTSRLLVDLERGRPELVVVAKWTWLRFSLRHPVYAWLAANYRPMPGGHDRGPYFQVYVRRGGALEQRLTRVVR